jgi:hypothetical protein
VPDAPFGAFWATSVSRVSVASLGAADALTTPKADSGTIVDGPRVGVIVIPNRLQLGDGARRNRLFGLMAPTDVETPPEGDV